MQARSSKLKVKAQIEKIIWITFFWVLFSVLQFLTGYSTLVDLNINLVNLNPTTFLKGSIINGIIAGLLGGSLIVFFWEKWLRTKSYRWSILKYFLVLYLDLFNNMANR